MPSIREKMAVVAPIPSARVSRTVREKPGTRQSRAEAIPTANTMPDIKNSLERRPCLQQCHGLSLGSRHAVACRQNTVKTRKNLGLRPAHNRSTPTRSLAKLLKHLAMFSLIFCQKCLRPSRFASFASEVSGQFNSYDRVGCREIGLVA